MKRILEKLASDGRTDVQKDKHEFVGVHELPTRGPKNVELLPKNIIQNKFYCIKKGQRKSSLLLS